MDRNKKIIQWVFILLVIVVVIWTIDVIRRRNKRLKNAETSYLNGSWYLNAPPDPYPNFPDWSL